MPNFQRLLDLIKINESRPIIMQNWKTETECGTVGCLIGNYELVNGIDGLINCSVNPSQVVKHCEHFGITMKEFEWLFTGFVAYRHPDDCIQARYTRNLLKVTKEQALARLRKFVYYKLHKAEMTLEEGRHVSGNQAVVRALEAV